MMILSVFNSSLSQVLLAGTLADSEKNAVRHENFEFNIDLLRLYKDYFVM